MSVIKKYKLKIESISNPLPDIYSIKFLIPKRIKYKPGQFLHLAIDDYDPSFPWPESRCFSMQSSPHDEFLKITYAVKGEYTKRMSEELFVGKEVWLKLPYGDLFQRSHNVNNSVFIAGGTGITPFLSLFNDESFSEYNKPVLYAGFRSKKYNIFEEELESIKNINGSIRMHVLYEDESGKLNIDNIFNEQGNKNYFISGPPQMISKFKDSLINFGVAVGQIFLDEWE